VHSTPPPSSRPKATVMPAPLVSARPNSAVPKITPHEPVKVYGGPSPIKRPSSATPGGGANRFVKDKFCIFENKSFVFSTPQDKKSNEVVRKSVLPAGKGSEPEKRHKELAKQKEVSVKKKDSINKNRFSF
jgi:hypothetical protein